MQEYVPMLKDALNMFIFLAAELSILFIVISAGVSLLQQYIPNEKIQKILGGHKGRGYLLAALLGAITPFCSCSTIPMLRGLLKAKAGFGQTLTFLFCSPLLNPIIIGLFIATFGIFTTLTYVCIALFISILAGYLLDKMKFEKYIIPEKRSPFESCCSSNISAHTCACESTVQSQGCCSLEQLQPLQPTSCCCGTSGKEDSSSCCSPAAQKNTAGFKERMKIAFSDGWNQFKQVFIYLLIGVSLGAFIYGFVPSDFIATYAGGDNIFAVPIAAIIGIPLYVRVEALIPLSAVLVGKGMGLGAVMALIIGGGGASLTELILLKSLFKMPMLIAFLGVILGMAIFAGYFFQLFV